MAAGMVALGQPSAAHAEEVCVRGSFWTFATSPTSTGYVCQEVLVSTAEQRLGGDIGTLCGVLVEISILDPSTR